MWNGRVCHIVTMVSLAPKILLNTAAIINAMYQLIKIFWTQYLKWLETFRTLCLKIRTIFEKCPKK